MKNKKILIVAAHPDDEMLGCFGTVARLILLGYEAYTLILGEGKTSRDKTRNVSNKADELKTLNSEILKANEAIGIKDVFTENFADNRFDSVDLLDIVKAVDKVKNLIKPDIIFTHFANDLNIDHRITYNAVLTATRPMTDECVREIYSFEILSSTEWNYPQSFAPDVFYDITQTLSLKQKAMSIYASELRKYPHPRSVDGIELIAKYHGMRVGLEYAEAFKAVRILR